MDKIAEEVLERSKGMCEVCYGAGSDLHHILAGHGRRKYHQNQYSVILLCKECHQGTYGVHGKHGSKLDKQLKIQLQNKYRELGFNEEETRQLMGGRLYLKEEVEE